MRTDTSRRVAPLPPSHPLGRMTTANVACGSSCWLTFRMSTTKDARAQSEAVGETRATRLPVHPFCDTCHERVSLCR
jgi:hypothetical protein